MFDDHVDAVGLARFAIALYRLLGEPLAMETRVLAELGVSFELGMSIDTLEALECVATDADATVLAVGLGADADVHYPGEELSGVWDSLPFIEAIKTGHVPDVGDSVVVIGGGNTAIDVTREARRLGASEVTLLYRRTRAEMPAYPQEVLEAEEEGVHLQWLAVPLRFF